MRDPFAAFSANATRFYELYLDELTDDKNDFKFIQVAYNMVIALRRGQDYRTKKVENVCKKLSIDYSAHGICAFLNS
jgi:hypothetical protein